MASIVSNTSRRGLLGILAALPIAASAIPAKPGNATTAFQAAKARYYASRDRFNALPSMLELQNPKAYAREEEAFLEASRAVDRTPAGSWAEFADAFNIATDDGDSVPNEDVIFKLLTDCRRLAAVGLN